MANIQNFSVPAGDAVEITLTIDPDAVVILSGTTVEWLVYPQAVGLVTPGIDPIMMKNSDGGGIVIGSPPDTFVISLVDEDTVGLLRNYYHEATVIDGGGNRVTVVQGIMTVTSTENR